MRSPLHSNIYGSVSLRLVPSRICGAVFGLLCASAEREAIWILPFAAGGFVYIALVSLIPDMYSQETPGFSWWRDVIHVGGGMALVTTTQLIENHYESH